MTDLKELCFSYSGECAVPFVSVSGFSGMTDIGINILIPNARELTPDSSIKWNFGGMDIFGFGFSFSLPYFERTTTDGVPNYDLSDTFTHPSYGGVHAGTPEKSTRYYPRVDVSASRIEYMSDTDTFRETLRDGTVTLYAARVFSQSGVGFIYYPISSIGPRGTTIRYSYRNTGEIARIEYEDLPGGGHAFVIDFSYELRQDEERSFCGGFQCMRSLRCYLVTISTVFGEKRKLREIAFKYDDIKGYSLLSRITETAFSGAEAETAPSIHISYGGDEEENFLDITSSLCGTDIGAAVPVSLYHEGACGLFAQYTFGAYYSAPVYSGSPMPRFAPRTLLQHLPACFFQNSPDNIFGPYSGSFLDLDGDGGIEWIAPDGDGYYEIKDGQFQSFTPFESICPFGSKTEFTDIYGDGKLSAFTVISTGKQARCEICRGRGRKGFGKSQIVSLPKDFPADSSLKTELVGFARFFGDGLQHRIILRNKSCTVFPNLGGGNFGDGISVGSAPDFGSGFDVGRIRIADTTGSGTDDIIYIEQTQIKIYRNIAGAFFQSPVTILLPERFTPSDSIYFADYFGDLLPQLVFVKQALSGTRVYSLRFARCFLVNGIENGSGLKTEIEYTSSAKFMLEDTASGHPWLSVPPFHIPVVSSLSSLDGVTGERNTTYYSYRDGRYIKYSHALYGFGTVNEKHIVTVPLLENMPADLLPPDRYITREYYVGESETPEADSFALLGFPLTTRHTGMDGTVLMQHVRAYQAEARKDPSGMSYYPALVEEEIEQSGENPRISRTFLTYDDYGNMTVSETHYLPSKGGNSLAEQRTEYVSKVIHKYINMDTVDTLRVGLPVSEAHSAGTDSDGISLVSLREYYYADPDSNHVLPAGSCKMPALLHHTRDIVFSIADPVIAGLEDTLLRKCGYCLENGSYYISNETCRYDADRFYLISSVSLGDSVTKISYDRYGIFVKSLEQVLTDDISLVEMYDPDYSVCAYRSRTDFNGNTEYYQYDAFGQLRGFSYNAVMGVLPKPGTLSDIITHPEAYLTENADAYFYNDRSAWEESEEGTCRVSITKKDTVSKGNLPEITLSLSYIDSYGRGYGQAVRDTDSWIISEKSIYAGDMKILEYPSYYSQEPWGEPTTYPVAYMYDTLGRVVRVYTLYPKPSLEWQSMEIEYEPWCIRTIERHPAPSAVYRFRQDLDPRGLALTDVFEKEDGDVLRYRIVRDNSGNIASVSDGRLAAAGLNNISYCYDRLERVVKTVSADAGLALKLYGTDGRLIYEDSNSTAKIYAYDALGRFTSLNVLNEGTECIAAEQVVWGEAAPDAKVNNLSGCIYQHTDLSGTVTYKQYDRFGHALVVERSYTEGRAVKAHYSYNLAGELTLAATEGFSLTYAYSLAGMLRTVSMPDGEVLSSVRYTAEGDICSETGAGGLCMSQCYDPITRFLAAQSVECRGTKIHEAAYCFTAQGNLAAVKIKTLDTEPLTASYNYDAHNRLERAEVSQGIYKTNEHYVYDDGGNIVSFTRMQNSVVVMSRIYEIAADSNRVDAAVINGVRYEFSYNDYGRPRRLTNGQELSYDAFGRLSSVSHKEGKEDYCYDASGRRTEKTDSGENQTVYFSGNSLAGDFMRCHSGCEILKLNYGGMLNTILIKSGTEVEIFRQVTDQRGSVILTVDHAGTILSHEFFSPYGEAVTDGTGIETPIGLTPYRFGGKEYDSETGLYYFGARYYSPEDGRMMTPDDVEYASPEGFLGLNLYAYCLDNPETFEDSSGNFPGWIAAVAGRIMTVAATAVPGVALGKYCNALSPERATAVAASSSIVGAIISATLSRSGIMNGIQSTFTTAFEVACLTYGLNCLKEKILSRYPRWAEHPKVFASYATVVNSVAAVSSYLIPGGFSAPKITGILGGAELGVVGSLFSGETGVPVSPQTGKCTCSELGVVEERISKNTGKGSKVRKTGCLVIDYNATEANQWRDLRDTMNLRYKGPVSSKPHDDLAEVTVIVHGGAGGVAFIDGEAPTYQVNGHNVPVTHRIVSAETLAADIKEKIARTEFRRGRDSIIKLISCHGSEGRFWLKSTAQTIANITQKRVAAYEGAISIRETIPHSYKNRECKVATMFTPKH